MMVGAAWSCEPVEAVRESLQVAWISPTHDTVKNGDYIEVVQVRDLRGWIRNNTPERERVLQLMGMQDRKITPREENQTYKITIFDVRREWLCRPMTEVVPGTDVTNVPACETRHQRAADRFHAEGFTGCGYSMDTQSSTRGLDVYRVRWDEASAWGFCVMPLERFLQGA